MRIWLVSGIAGSRHILDRGRNIREGIANRRSGTMTSLGPIFRSLRRRSARRGVRCICVALLRHCGTGKTPISPWSHGQMSIVNWGLWRGTLHRAGQKGPLKRISVQTLTNDTQDTIIPAGDVQRQIVSLSSRRSHGVESGSFGDLDGLWEIGRTGAVKSSHVRRVRGRKPMQHGRVQNSRIRKRRYPATSLGGW